MPNARPLSTRLLSAVALLGLAAAALAGPTVAEPAQKAAGAARAAATAKPPPSGGTAAGGSGLAIVVIVNELPITGYEIEQRQALEALSDRSVGDYVRANAEARWKRMAQDPKLNEEFRAYATARNPKSQAELQSIQKAFVQEKQKRMMEELQREARSRARSKVYKSALEDLIEEKLKLSTARKLGVLADDNDVDTVMKTIAGRNNMTPQQFAQHLKGLGVDIATMRDRFRATVSWNNAIRRRFGAQVNISDRDVDRAVAATAGKSGDGGIELQVQRITLTFEASDQKAMAERIALAEKLRGRFGGCKTMAKLATGVAGAQHEDLGRIEAATIQEPTRSMLVNAKDGELLPPSVGQGGVELWAVCGRKSGKGTEERRAAAQDELRQREFEMHSRRFMKDVRADATYQCTAEAKTILGDSIPCTLR